MIRRLESSEYSGCQDLSALEEKRCMKMRYGKYRF
jgi:hypothetical protein